VFSQNKIDVEDEGISLDYKVDLVLEKEGDKAEFIKDVISLANSSKVSHIIIGIEDRTRKLVGLKTFHTVEQLNDTLKNRCDPPISLEYTEEKILGHQVGVVEIHGEDPPYIISVSDKFGGTRTSGEPCNICRGMLFIRNNNKNEGAIRANI
jgi:predicted HTH transcriptional regulator